MNSNDRFQAAGFFLTEVHILKIIVLHKIKQEIVHAFVLPFLLSYVIQYSVLAGPSVLARSMQDVIRLRLEHF